jgi:hypothetical protein
VGGVGMYLIAAGGERWLAAGRMEGAGALTELFRACGI